MAFAVNHLTGRARVCGTAKWEKQTSACSSFDTFSQELQKVFCLARCGPDASCPLMGMCQEDRSVPDFAIDYCIREREQLELHFPV